MKITYCDRCTKECEEDLELYEEFEFTGGCVQVKWPVIRDFCKKCKGDILEQITAIIRS